MVIEIVVSIGERTRSLTVFPALVFPFISHEAIRMSLELSAHSGMIREIRIETWVSRKVVRIVHQPRIVPQLARDFGMLIEVTVVEARYFTARDACVGCWILRHRGGSESPAENQGCGQSCDCAFHGCPPGIWTCGADEAIPLVIHLNILLRSVGRARQPIRLQRKDFTIWTHERRI